jgi:hypothetical protein
MKIFLSWSGELSKNLADVIRQWLPSVIQAVKPYFSPDDMSKGARWNAEISKELEESKIGILCLTRDNLEAPWIMFEAGALAKKIDKSKVCPILFGIETTDIQGPLVQFQAARFEKEEIKKLVRMINAELGELGLGQNVLDEVFEMWWPKLKERIELELTSAKAIKKQSVRSERDLLEEILSLTRGVLQATDSRISTINVNQDSIEGLILAFEAIVRLSTYVDKTKEISQILERMFVASQNIIEALGMSKKYGIELAQLYTNYMISSVRKNQQSPSVATAAENSDTM